MQSKALSRRRLLIVVLIGFAFFLIFIFYSSLKKSVQSSPTFLDKQGIVDYGLPTRLKIPRINVETIVESVGLTSSGAMDVSKDRDNVAWYSSGPRPGEVGSAVIDGHYGVWKNGQTTVFNDLDKLRLGDKLSIEEDNGAIISFVVRKTQLYDPQADASNIFNSNDGLSHLNLITCKGIWDQVSKSYPGRLVVFTDRE